MSRNTLFITLILFPCVLWAQGPSAADHSALQYRAATQALADKQDSALHKVDTTGLDDLDQEGLKYSYLEQPLYSAQTIKEWAEKIALLCFNYDYQDYVNQFSKLSVYFTYNGWKRFLSFLWLSPDYSLEQLVAAHLSVGAQRIAPSTIWARFPDDGRFIWEVLVPIEASYQGPGVNIVRNINLVLTVSRVSTKIQKNGIAVIAIREIKPGTYAGILE